MVVQDEDDHVLEAMLGFPLFTDSQERLGWLMNLNAARTCSHAPLPELQRLGICYYSLPLQPCRMLSGLSCRIVMQPMELAGIWLA